MMEKMPNLNICENTENSNEESGEEKSKKEYMSPVESVLFSLGIEEGGADALRLDANIFNFLDAVEFSKLRKRLKEGDEKLARILINYTDEFKKISYTNPNTVVQEQIDLGKETLDALRAQLADAKDDEGAEPYDVAA